MSDSNKLFVAGLPYSVSEEAVRQAFVRVGLSIVDLAIPKDRATGLAKGFAFVTLASEADAQRAISQLDGATVEGRPMRIRPFSNDPVARTSDGGGFRPRERSGPREDDSNRTLFLGNLAQEVNEEVVRDFFAKIEAPSPSRITLPKSPEGKLRGFGFVVFDTPDHATDALSRILEPVMAGQRCAIHMATPKAQRPQRPERPEGGGGGFDRGFARAGGGGGFMRDPAPKDEGRRRKQKPQKKKSRGGHSWDDDGYGDDTD